MVVNTLYLDSGVLKSIKKTYSKQYPKNIRLEKFFQPSIFALLYRKICSANFSLKFNPYKYKYSITKIKEINSFLNGKYFSDLIKNVLDIKSSEIKYEIRKFVAGNYTLLHDAEKEKPGIDFVLDFSASKDNYGGYIVYLTESEELLQLNPFPNCLSFIKREKKVMKYTKYVQDRQKHLIVQVVGTIFNLRELSAT